MDTIEQLKQAAREREEQERLESERSRSELYVLLLAESPLGREATIQIEEAWNDGIKTIVTFQLPFHADIQATYARCVNDHFDKDADKWMPGPWYHEGFDKTERYEGNSYSFPDKTRQWRVVEWTGTQYDPESETYEPTFKNSYFENLGDALLTAERVFVVPEPTTAEKLITALRAFLNENAGSPEA